MDKLVSIIIPVYNREEIVKDAINASLTQDYKNIEIILIDDGSTDNTLKVLEEYQSKYPNIKLISQSNQGALKARLAGLKIATGDFVVFLDSDDIINKSFVSGLIAAQKVNNADITIARMRQYVNFNNLYLKLTYRKYPTQFDMFAKKEVLPFMWVGNAAKLFRRDAINMMDCGLVANEDLAVNYFNYVRYHNMAANNHSIYTIRPAINSLAENYIRQNLNYIENTIIPLESELNLFLTNGYYEIFYSELEAIFIHNILERIDNIKTNSTIDSIQKGKLISILIEYLNFNFPNWTNNKYYKNKFMEGSIYEIYFALTTRKQVREYYSNFQRTPLETIDSYKRVLQK